MGQIRIDLLGSFKPLGDLGRSGRSAVFSALNHGHADAVAQAIEFLAAEVLPMATAQDHELVKDGHMPEKGFARLGATGEFPAGKLNAEDEGELRLAVAADKEYGIVRVEFGKACKWIGLRPHEAEAFAASLMKKAEQFK